MTESDMLFQQWNGHVVPRSFNAGFVTLSYVVSLIGAASTLELINRRTSPKGKFNHMLLLSAAITMGGVAIWCMHFIGNRAINLAGGQTELQIAYSSGFTALSFFVPIIVLLAAFVAIGANNAVSWWRVAIGGTLAGAAICGMHYLGNASINNYVCIYNLPNVVGSAIIAVAASIAALSLFFVYRAKWENAWWKRAVSAVVLAGAVSGMHWCASTGTQYKLVAINQNDELSRNTTVIVVICLSVGACFIMAGTAMYTARILKRYAHKAQQVVLAAAIFDKQGRVLVTPDGLLPSETITQSLFEKTPRDSFSVAHPLFHWMFQASRNWPTIAAVLTGISNHLAHLPQEAARGDIRLVNDHGDPIEHYEVVLRELFCVAAAALADRLKSPMTQLGVLWDDILPTGAGGQMQTSQQVAQGPDADSNAQRSGTADTVLPTGDHDLAEKGIPRPRYQDLGRGSLMFLVRRVDSHRDVDALEAAGFRFAEIQQVSGIIGSAMQIKARDVSHELADMARYAEESSALDPGVHLGFFGVRARVGATGFDVLVRRGARNLLPSTRLPYGRLESWQADFVRQFDGLTPSTISRKIEHLRNATPREISFASELATGIKALRGWIDDDVFDETILTAKPMKAPCGPTPEGSSSSTCTMIFFRAVIPIHHHISNAGSTTGCCFIPLNLLKLHQLVHANSPAHLAFSRSVHREILPVINAATSEKKPGTGVAAGRYPRSSFRDSRVPNRLRRLTARPHTASSWAPVDEDGNEIPVTRGRRSSAGASNMSTSTLKLWRDESHSGRDLSSPRKSSADSEYGGGLGLASLRSPRTAAYQQQPTFGGIMVSQEITVQVDRDEQSPSSEPDLNRDGVAFHRRARTSSRGKGAGLPLAKSGEESLQNLKGDQDGAIELRLFTDRPIIHDGTGMHISNVEAGRLTETETFVDDLFAICMESR